MCLTKYSLSLRERVRVREDRLYLPPHLASPPKRGRGNFCQILGQHQPGLSLRERECVPGRRGNCLAFEIRVRVKV